MLILGNSRENAHQLQLVAKPARFRPLTILLPSFPGCFSYAIPSLLSALPLHFAFHARSPRWETPAKDVARTRTRWKACPRQTLPYLGLPICCVIYSPRRTDRGRGQPRGHHRLPLTFRSISPRSPILFHFLFSFPFFPFPFPIACKEIRQSKRQADGNRKNDAWIIPRMSRISRDYRKTYLTGNCGKNTADAATFVIRPFIDSPRPLVAYR